MLTIPSLGVIALIVFIALSHLTDRHRVDHVSGAWMALTRYASEGVLYPPLFDGERFGGTRWMPLSVVYNLCFAQLGDDLMTTGKLAALFAWAVVLWLTYVLLRRLEVSRAVAIFLLAAIAAADPLLLAAWAPFRGDAPALALQLVAVLLVLRPRSSSMLAAAAGAVSATAFLAKASAGWAPMGIGLYLLARDRRRLGAFVGAYVVVFFGGMLLFESLSEGRMMSNLVGLSTNALGPARLLGAAGRMLYVIETEVLALWLLVPLAIADIGWSAAQGRLHLAHLLMAACAFVSVVIFADPGVASNHLVDLLVLSAIVAGLLLRRLEGCPPARNLLLVLVGWALVAGFDLGVFDPLKELRRGTDAHSKAVYAQLAKPHHRVLSEDPALPVRLGQDPLVLDAFMWHRLDESMPGNTLALVERVQRQEFDRIVLLKRAEEGLTDGWYVDSHFSAALVRAVLARYRLLRSVKGYWVYEPAR